MDTSTPIKERMEPMIPITDPTVPRIPVEITSQPDLPDFYVIVTLPESPVVTALIFGVILLPVVITIGALLQSDKITYRNQ